MTDEECEEWMREQRRECAVDRQGGLAFFKACRSGDAGALHDAMHYISDFTCAGWVDAFRRVIRLSSVSSEISKAFAVAWITNKSIARNFDSHMPVIRALRVLLPAYRGQDPVRLYRGVSAREQRTRKYGISWTADPDTAEKFATDARRASEGGSMILETTAPVSSIISALDANADHYGEKEFFIDRRQLGQVKVYRRYNQITPEEWTRQSQAFFAGAAGA